MPSLPAGSAGIHMQAIERRIEHDLQDMRMPGDEESSRSVLQQRLRGFRVSARIAADMHHEYGNILTVPSKDLRKSVPCLLPVDVPEYAPQRPEGFQLFHKLHAAEITRMPDFITAFEMPEDGIVKIPMRV